tara:strand:- start:1314 stop:1424 length:111 start_codon:yes stop_codon:yes gene_type:complete
MLDNIISTNVVYLPSQRRVSPHKKRRFKPLNREEFV